MPDDPNWYAPPGMDAPPPPSSEGVENAAPEYAGFFVRCAGRVLDIIAVMVCGWIGGMLGAFGAAALASSGVMSAGWTHRIQSTSASGLAIGAVAVLGYHALSEGLDGASVGKAVLGLRVKSEELRACGVGSASVRNVAYYVDGCFFGLVAYSVMSKSPRQQRLGDKWGHTVVVRAASLPASARQGLGLGMVLGIVVCVVLTALSILVRAL